MADGEDVSDYMPLNDSNSSNNAQDTPIYDQDDDDSASDVSMAAETDDESEPEPPLVLSTPAPRDEQPGAAAVATVSPVPANNEVGQGVSRKRKSLADIPDEQNLLENQEVKKVKTQQAGLSPLGNGKSVHDRSALPAEVWHHIFTFCPPRTLGRLLLVNKLFHSYLNPSSTIPRDGLPSLSPGHLTLLKPNFIWQASRRRFWPTMPTPLQDKTELDMWQLSCATSCQFCCKPAAAQQPEPLEPWQAGPGKEGVSIVWAFASRSCGACLLSKSTKVCICSQHESESLHPLTGI